MTHVTTPGHGHGHGLHSGSGRLYDLGSHLFFVGRRRQVFSRLATVAGASPGDRVLDVGCGTGYFTRVMARAVAPGGSAVGIDPGTEGLARARAVNRLPNCSFSKGSAEALDFADGSFDIVVTSLVIHHIPEDHRQQAIGEMQRVLRPGGRVVVADFRPPTGRLGRLLLHRVTSPAMEHNPVHLLEPMVRRAGFEDVAGGEVQPWITYVTGVKPAG